MPTREIILILWTMFLALEGECVLVSAYRVILFSWSMESISTLGLYFAQLSLFLNITSILQTFNITKAIGIDGKEVEPVVAYSSGVTRYVDNILQNRLLAYVLASRVINPMRSHPIPFECKIEMRSDAGTLLAEN